MSTQVKFSKYQCVAYATLESLVRRLEELKSSSKILEYACILHDIDKEDGKPKPLHCHFAFKTAESLNPTQVKKWFIGLESFPGEKNANVMFEWLVFANGKQQTVDLRIADRYQLHLDYPNKAQYTEELQVCSEGWKELIAPKVSVAKVDNTFDILEEMLNGVSNYELAKKYGRDFILNFRKYADLVACINTEYSNADHYANIREYEENKAFCHSMGIYTEGELKRKLEV